jgi:hypothetical protein
MRVPNQESVRFNIEGHLVPAVLHKLSLTGGLAEFTGPIGDVTIAEAKLTTACGPVSGLVEFLRLQKKQGPNTYAFRFIALSDGDHQRLSATLQLMNKLGLGEKKK